MYISKILVIFFVVVANCRKDESIAWKKFDVRLSQLHFNFVPDEREAESVENISWFQEFHGDATNVTEAILIDANISKSVKFSAAVEFHQNYEFARVVKLKFDESNQDQIFGIKLQEGAITKGHLIYSANVSKEFSMSKRFWAEPGHNVTYDLEYVVSKITKRIPFFAVMVIDTLDERIDGKDVFDLLTGMRFNGKCYGAYYSVDSAHFDFHVDGEILVNFYVSRAYNFRLR